MKKLQLSIVTFALFMVFFTIMTGVLTVTSAFGGDYSDFQFHLQNAPTPEDSTIANIAFLYPDFDPGAALHPHISGDAHTEDINLDTDIDTADSDEGLEIHERDVSLISQVLKDTQASIERCIAQKIFNFPPEVSRLRI